MHEIRIEIDEIDKMLEDLNQKLSEESKLKIELDEYIAKEIETKSSNQIESIRSQCNELHVLLSKHKQHLWNHIQAIKLIRQSAVTHQKTLSDTKTGLQEELGNKFIELSKKILTHKSNTESSINIVKTEITTKLSEYYAELSEKNKALDKELADLINVITTEHSSIKDNLETLNNCKEFVDSEIPKLHELRNNMGNDIAQVSKSIFDADGHLESRIRETLGHSVDKEGFYKFVEKVEEDQRLKDRLIKNLRKVSIAQSIVLVLTISFIIIRLLLY